jgi:amidase
MLAKAMRVRHQVRALYDGALAGVDALLLPTTARTAPRLPAEGASLFEQIQATMEPAGNTGQFDVSGHPAVSVPAGTVGGLPVGAMLVGAHFDEPLLYRLAEAIEAG